MHDDMIRYASITLHMTCVSMFLSEFYLIKFQFETQHF